MNIRPIFIRIPCARVFVCCVGGTLLSGCSGKSHAPIQTIAPPSPRTKQSIVSDRWRDATAKERQIAQQIVQEQLRAFRDKNYQKAIDLETERFAANLSTLSQLSRLIENSYPAFNHVRSIQWRRTFYNDADKSIRLGLRFTTTRKEIIGVRYSLKLENKQYRIDSIEASMIEQPQRVSKPWPFNPVF